MTLNRITQMAFLRNKEIYNSKKEAKEGLKNAAKAHSNNDLKSISIFECDEIIVDGKNDNDSDEINDSPYGKNYKNYLKELSKVNVKYA